MSSNQSSFNPGDTAYIVESGWIIREVKIVKIAGGMVTVRFTDTDGGIRLRESRIFPTKEAAEESTKRAGRI